MPDFRRGAAAIKAAQEEARANAGEFKPFTPSIFWPLGSEDSEKYVLFLNPLDDIPTIDKLISYIPVEVKGLDKPIFEQAVSRTDQSIGEDSDPMESEWGADPKVQQIGVAVELEATYQERAGRSRPVGFEVKTNEYSRRVRDDEGELTDERETVEVPVIGFVSQSPFNFYNLITSVDEKDGPIEATPLRIERVDKNTYKVDPFLDQPVDLSALVETIDGLSYLQEDELEELLEQVDSAESDEAAALIIGEFLLDKRLDELADRERYDELFEGIDKPFKFGKKDKGNDNKDEKKARRQRRERPARKSQRRQEEPEQQEEQSEPEAESEAEEKPKRRRARKSEPKAEKSEAKSEGSSSVAKLKERQAKRKAAASK